VIEHAHPKEVRQELSYTNFGDGITKARLQELWTSICTSPKINILFWHTKVAQTAHDNHLNPAWKSLGRSLINTCNIHRSHDFQDETLHFFTPNS
jgi:hypothetical protein